MSRINGQATGNASRSSSGQPLNAENLAQVPPVSKSQIGLRKYILNPPHEESYYLAARISDRDAYEKQMDERIASIEELMRR
ncbi:hypothetical protein TMatcc_008740 [Talaromyces marneffei ATCC 18224]|uniref:Uncharacterized protein n=1 Tax=Talaromyces marneffei (strain ATCC 18224 / CBS 334.59 / QM 7333) TaxID=441960 RepID=B6QL58_TALMQ|nr:hypothetical protein PMAA_056270 [Talaromyces marneffei ATCC 18224]KAE8550693.1 hypothetical protein EYB25_006921 [Talaromyces marneffei]